MIKPIQILPRQGILRSLEKFAKSQTFPALKQAEMFIHPPLCPKKTRKPFGLRVLFVIIDNQSIGRRLFTLVMHPPICRISASPGPLSQIGLLRSGSLPGFH